MIYKEDVLGKLKTVYEGTPQEIIDLCYGINPGNQKVDKKDNPEICKDTLEYNFTESEFIKRLSTKQLVEELRKRKCVQTWSVGVDEKYSINVNHKNNIGTAKSNACGPTILLEIID